jgi:hypothetical protein
MTAKQKANQARFKKVVAEAKKLRKKNPKLTQAQAVKEAWAMTYSKKDVSVGNVPLSKFEVGDNVYSYQNKTYKAPIAYKKFVPWESLSKPNSKDKYVYKLKLKDGYSNYINEESLSKKSIGGMPTKVKAKKGKRTSEMHTDTKSHNVNIRVMSGLGTYENPENILFEINYWQKQLDKLRAEYKSEKGKLYKHSITQDIRLSKKWLEINKKKLKAYITKIK